MMNCDEAEILNLGILTKEELDFYNNVRIPYIDTEGLWLKVYLLQDKVLEALKSGVLKEKPSTPPKRSRSFEVISDDLGINGVLNPATGKKYDSKSQYYKSVKQAGCVVLGNDAPKEGKKTMSGDFDPKRELKAALDYHTRGGSLTINSQR